MNRLLTAEVLAAAGALEVEGFTEIYVNDAHGYSLLFEEFPESCRIVHGRGGYGPSWTPFLDEKMENQNVRIGIFGFGGRGNSLLNENTGARITTVIDTDIPRAKFYMNERVSGALTDPLVKGLA